ncbi:hypothetical protein BKA63DRAFT_528923 [Paraphoma chrysanthemicola]|nr:hypothetical protein BKA63DRAFT_528923 [Paraphoma chrysanthemicola]
MASCCQTCQHRNHAVQTLSTETSKLDVCFITLKFQAPIMSNLSAYTTLNTVLNNIIDSVETSAHPTTFTSWSPCLSNQGTAIIITTAKETCSSSMSPVFDGLRQYLRRPPHVQHIYFDFSILSLAASSPEHRVACDIYQLQAPNPGIAAAIGKHFGWNPTRSSLTLQMSSCVSAAFSHPGDLIKDFWVWAELQHEDSISPSTVGSSFASSHETLPKPSPLINWNSDEKNMSLPFPEEDRVEPQAMDDETLVMIFQWTSHADADRFKHPLQTSYGPNGQEIRKDMWESHVAHPIRQLQGIGARLETYKLELRAVEPRITVPARADQHVAGRVRSGSKRLSIMASGLSERVSGLWK